MRFFVTFFLIMVMSLRAFAIIPSIPTIPDNGKRLTSTQNSVMKGYISEIYRLKRRATAPVKVKVNNFDIDSEVINQSLLPDYLFTPSHFNSIFSHKTVYLDVLIKPPIFS